VKFRLSSAPISIGDPVGLLTLQTANSPSPKISKFSRAVGPLKDKPHSLPPCVSMKSPHLVWFDGPVDGVSFRAYVEQFVVPCTGRNHMLLSRVCFSICLWTENDDEQPIPPPADRRHVPLGRGRCKHHRDIGRSCAVIENGRAERERESSTDRVSV
jgi:hypothetical protein